MELDFLRHGKGGSEPVACHRPRKHLSEEKIPPERSHVFPVLKVEKPPIALSPDPHHVKAHRLRSPAGLPQVSPGRTPENAPLPASNALVGPKRIRLARAHPHLDKYHQPALPHHQVQLPTSLAPAPVQEPHPRTLPQVPLRHLLPPFSGFLTPTIPHPSILPRPPTPASSPLAQFQAGPVTPPPQKFSEKTLPPPRFSVSSPLSQPCAASSIG